MKIIFVIFLGQTPQRIFALRLKRREVKQGCAFYARITTEIKCFH